MRREVGAFNGPFWGDLLAVGVAGQLLGGFFGLALAAFYNYVFRPPKRLDLVRFAGLCQICVGGAAASYVAVGHAVRAIFF